MTDMDSSHIVKNVVLPNEGFIRLEVAMAVFGCKKTKFLQGVKDGVIPRPYKWGRSSLWDVNEIREALARLRIRK